MMIRGGIKVLINQQNTKYWKDVFIEIYVTYSIYKLAQCANLLMCSRLFIVKKSTICLVLCEFVYD